MIEADWLFDDIYGIQLGDSDLAVLFPFADRASEGQPTNVEGESLAVHLRRLAAVPEILSTLRIQRIRPATSSVCRP